MDHHSAEGHRLFLSGRHIAAADAYSCAIAWGWSVSAAERSLLYTNRAACWLMIAEKEAEDTIASLGDLLKLKDRVRSSSSGGGGGGRPTRRMLLECVVEDCTISLKLSPGYGKTLWRRALALEQLSTLSNADADADAGAGTAAYTAACRAAEAVTDIEHILLQAPQYKPAIAKLRKWNPAKGKAAAEAAAAAAAAEALQNSVHGGGAGSADGAGSAGSAGSATSVSMVSATAATGKLLVLHTEQGQVGQMAVDVDAMDDTDAGQDLPDDVLQLIFANLGWRDFCRARCVCKQWYAVVPYCAKGILSPLSLSPPPRLSAIVTYTAQRLPITILTCCRSCIHALMFGCNVDTVLYKCAYVGWQGVCFALASNGCPFCSRFGVGSRRVWGSWRSSSAGSCVWTPTTCPRHPFRRARASIQRWRHCTEHYPTGV